MSYTGLNEAGVIWGDETSPKVDFDSVDLLSTSSTNAVSSSFRFKTAQ